MDTDVIRPLSTALAEPIRKAYLAGGFGLAFLSLGAPLMLIAYFLDRRPWLSYPLFGVGLLLVLLTCILFYFQDIRPLRTTQDRLEANKELVDAIQAAAIQLAELASDLQALAFKHATSIAELLSVIRPQVRKIPFVGQLADSEAVVRADDLSATIVSVTGSAKSVIADVQKCLTTCDAAGLKKYVAELQQLEAGMLQVLSAKQTGA